MTDVESGCLSLDVLQLLPTQCLTDPLGEVPTLTEKPLVLPGTGHANGLGAIISGKGRVAARLFSTGKPLRIRSVLRL